MTPAVIANRSDSLGPGRSQGESGNATKTMAAANPAPIAVRRMSEDETGVARMSDVIALGGAAPSASSSALDRLVLRGRQLQRRRVVRHEEEAGDEKKDEQEARGKPQQSQTQISERWF
jgi:hypothetical protein